MSSFPKGKVPGQCTYGFKTIKNFVMGVEGQHSAVNDVSAVAGD
jgi:hypothetical protein